MDKLNEIMNHKRKELEGMLRPIPSAELKSLVDLERPNLFDALYGHEQVSVISEIKRKSPSAGDIAKNASALSQAKLYETAEADGISILTDQKYFSGSLEDLETVTGHITQNGSNIPCIRKDFFIHPIQVVEAANAGASAILIIARALSNREISDLFSAANQVGLDSIFEIHNEGDLERSVSAGAKIIGVNNRNLATFTTDLALSERLIPQIPKECASIAESGIFNLQDIVRLKAAGAQAVLIGQALMEHSDPGSFIREIHSL